MKVHCLYDEMIDPNDLIPHPSNRNEHPVDQIAKLADILKYQGWRYAIKVSRQTKYVTSGHGRILAAKVNGWAKVPIVYQDYENFSQEYSDIQSDNAIASWSDLDIASINADLPNLGPDFDIELLGIKNFVLDPSEHNDEGPKCPTCNKRIK